MQESATDGVETRSPSSGDSDWALQSVNILVIGEESSVKAKFISTFLGAGIDRDPASESGFRKNIQFDDKNYGVNIHTDVGQESFPNVCDVCIRRTDAAIFIYNIYARESFLAFGGWRDKLQREHEHMPIAVVGCADRVGGDDVHTREVTTAEALKLAETCGGVFFELGSFDVILPIKEIAECFALLLARVSSRKPGYYEKPTDDPDQQKYTDLEIVVCGDVFVGKTQLIRKLLSMPFQGAYNATLGTNVSKYKAVIQDVGFILKIVDVGGLDIDPVLTRDNLMTSQGFVLVYNANSRDSFNALENIRKKITQAKGETARIPLVLVANKTDLFRQVTKEEGQALAKKWSCAYFEASAKGSSNEEIAECFEVLISDVQHIFAHVPILDAIGDLDRQGYLGKEGNTFKSVNRRYVTMKDCTLSYSNDINQPFKSSIFLVDATAEPVLDAKKGEGFPFIVTSGDEKEKIILSAATEAERDSWLASIKANLAIADVANSMLDEVMRAMLWETCAKMSEVVRRRINTDEPSTPPKSPGGTASPRLQQTPSSLIKEGGHNASGGLGISGGVRKSGEKGEKDDEESGDFMAPAPMHDLSSSPSASPPTQRSSPALYKSKSFFRTSSKEKK